MTGFITRISTGAALALCAATGALAADVAINAVPPAQYRPAANAKAAQPAMLLDASAPSRRIALDAPSDAEIGALRKLNAATKDAAASRAGATKGRALAIGFGRGVPAASQQVALDTLDWVAAANGVRAARIEIASPGAAGVRVAMSLSRDVPGMTARFTGTTGAVFGPVDATVIRGDVKAFGSYWSPVVDGEVAVIELAVPAGASVKGAQLSFPLLSHSLVPAAELRAPSAKRIADIGSALPCEVDVACVTPSAALASAASAVAKIIFTKPSGSSYLCTGQLLNDTLSDFKPYFFTANHCIDSAQAASTINSYWFFDANACGSQTVGPSYTAQAFGAKLLARSPDWDWSIVRLNAAPPAGANFSAWRAATVADGTALTVLHHPEGDLKKYSDGFASGTSLDDLYGAPTPATFVRMSYNNGQAEGGSSGSGILTFNNAGGYYEVRGGLYFGDSNSCPRPAGYSDKYSRIENMVPLVRDYLTPGNNPAGTVVAVEFYNAALDHYFLSTNPSEINDLDTGVHPGWVRTGIRFNAYASPFAGASPVCRFYRAPAYGDSHFYSASPAECAATALQHPVDWIYESAAVFYIQLPDAATGNCPANTRPLWRFFNTVTTNHRYTPEAKLRDDMRFDPATWIAEGYGPDAVIMCSPLGS